ncbi:hypothetical protein ACJIZ3_012625 [Penstemon smallii]|uniref:Uncharacterized protein n=1 Tax=Penstemon smallii TaxID=265156 RepID=A0ABD3URS8_9LAMI
MDSYSGTFQWYQSSRSSAVLQKNEKEIEMEYEDYPPRHYHQHRGYSEIYGIDSKNFGTRVTVEAKSVENVHEPKNFHERIDQNMAEIRRMIADMTSKKSNYSDFSSNSVSNQQSTFDRESLHLSDTKSMRNFQVSLESGTSELHKQYKVYSSYELNDKRDRGLCLCCDELWFIGHDCCKKKKFYVFDVDVDDALEVNENYPIESQVDVNFAEEAVSHCQTKLIEDCVENESTVWSEVTCADGKEGWESSEVLGKNCIVEDNDLQVFDKMCEMNTFANIAEKCVVYTIDSENVKLGTLEVALECMMVLLPSKELWLCDEGSGILMDNVVKDQLLKHVGMMFNLLSVLRGLKLSWIAWPELPVPPPEPPPRMLWAVDWGSQGLSITLLFLFFRLLNYCHSAVGYKTTHLPPLCCSVHKINIYYRFAATLLICAVNRGRLQSLAVGKRNLADGKYTLLLEEGNVLC